MSSPIVAQLSHIAVANVRFLMHLPLIAVIPELIATLLQAIKAAPREGKRALVLSGAPGMFSAGFDVRLLLKFDLGDGCPLA